MYRHSLQIMVVLLAAVWFSQVAWAQSVPDRIEMIGVLEAVGNGTVTVNGQIIQITTAQIAVELSAGQIVKIEGTTLADGTIFAREIRQPASVDLRIGEIELTGVVDRIDDNSITINGLVIDLSAAEINATLAVGAAAKVHASLSDDGRLVAREAENVLANVLVGDNTVNSNPQIGNRAGEFEITGTLDGVGDGFIVVNGQRIDIAGAEIKNALVPGALVKVHLGSQNGTLIAREVENAATLGSDDSRNGDDNSGRGSVDDRGGSGSGSSDDSRDNSGSGSDDSGGNSGSGRGGDDSHDNSGSGHGGDDSRDNSGSGRGRDD